MILSVFDRMVQVAASGVLATALVLIAYVTVPPTNRRVWFALILVALSPVGLALAVFDLTPTYFRPLITTSLGLWMLAGLLAAVLMTYAVVNLGSRQAVKGRVALGVALIVTSMLLGTGSILMLILLGPSVAILFS